LTSERKNQSGTINKQRYHNANYTQKKHVRHSHSYLLNCETYLKISTKPSVYWKSVHRNCT